MIDAISFFNSLEDCPLCGSQLRGLFICTESKIDNLFSNSYEERFYIERYIKKSKYIFYCERDPSRTIDLLSINPLNISVSNLYCQNKDDNGILEHYSLLPARETFYIKQGEKFFTISCSRDNIVISIHTEGSNYDRELVGDFYLRFRNRLEIENFIKKASLL